MDVQYKKVKNYVKVLQLEAELTADGHGHVGVYLDVSNINLSAGPHLANISLTYSGLWWDS